MLRVSVNIRKFTSDTHHINRLKYKNYIIPQETKKKKKQLSKLAQMVKNP